MLGHPTLPRVRARGFTLIELMIVLTIFGIVTAVGVPLMRNMLLNAQLRTAAETTVAGLNVARQEAIRRNQTVRFQLVTTLDASCALSTTGTNWVVSLLSPAGACQSDPIRPDDDAPTSPAVIQKKSGAEGSASATVTADTSTLTFSGLGRLSGSGNMSTINIAHTTETCEHVSSSGAVRCLRILISSGGTIKMCDPKVTATTDPRICSV